MKSLMILALAAGSIAAVTPAVAADQVTTVQHTKTVVHRDSGWHATDSHRKHRVCKTSWRNHHKVRHCYWR